MAASETALEIQYCAAIAIGGHPGDLMGQAVDGVADITMTLVGYPLGQFPRYEAFELRFIMTDRAATANVF